MGMILEDTPEMGEYSVEVRSESFYLRGEYNGPTDEEYAVNPDGYAYVKRRHGIHVCENGDTHQGTVEILLEDIPKIRAAFDEIEKYLKETYGQDLPPAPTVRPTTSSTTTQEPFAKVGF